MNSSDARKDLVSDMLSIGEPIPWDLCNLQGKVVFRKGFVVNTRTSRERILGMRLHIAPASDRDAAAARPRQAHGEGPLHAIDKLADRVSELFTGICQELPPDLSELLDLVESARRLYIENPDGCLAAVHFNHGRSYQSLHAIYSLFLAVRVAGELSRDEAYTRIIAAAALTANLGMFEFHDEWASQKGSLTDAQNQARLQHPDISARRLQAVGVSNDLWLRIVRQHHELADGNGYPRGLAGKDVAEEARVIGLVDDYLAWVLPRAGRKVSTPASVLGKIYENEGKYGGQLAQVLIKVIGVYPPGTVVRLANGETAVVLRRSLVGDTVHPQVVTVRQKDKRCPANQVVRDTSQDDYRIIDVYLPREGEVNPAYMVREWC